ncbi:hypothetical protein [Microbacterium hominis]|uniref:hypothetical protein n=1 Tax=Microbacterium hominis TaxID=162426 RepID=UPI0012FB9777|nr:hypothetical protein [Microbacterium hominis]
MMASVHEIGIAADTRGFDEGVRSGIIKPLEKAEDAFKDMERAATDAGRDGSRSVGTLEDALRDAQRQSERLEDSLNDVGDGGRRGMEHIRGGAQELQQEIGSNLGEAVSSFRGDMSDLGQVGQDTFGGLAATVAGLGPGGLIGALALAAGAAGLGLVTAGLQDAEERQERLAESAAEWAKAYQEAGTTILNASQIVARGQDIFGDPEKYKEAETNAKNWGVELSTAVAAMAGSDSAISAVNDALDAQTKALEDNAAGADNYAQNIEQATTGQSEANNALMDGRRAFDELTGSMKVGRETAGYISQMMADIYRSTEGATEKVDEFGDTIITLPDGKQLYIDVETGQATEDADAIERRIYAIPSSKSVRVDVDMSDFNRKMDAINRRAAEGVSVVVHPTLGRVIQ